ncbi:MAG: aminoacetone oxidase family FAD-binding enzyme [Oscillospiraceae bacterium]|nr:aminoacetone oxidase family FAD-binding enzyme [Oscillospiraceae bacterium]
MRIGIIGGGAAGMAAALAAAEYESASVVLMERQARLGRKLSATGNGRCNLSNLHASEGGYNGDDPHFHEYALEKFPPEETLQWFADLGLYTVAEPSGKIYPYSDQANSVVDVLRFSLEKPNIEILTDFEVMRVKKTGETFSVTAKDRTLEFDKLIIACGGLAGTKLGGTMAGYKLLRAFGHKCTKLRPALVQVKTSWPGVSALKGVRANCRAAIYHNGKRQRQSVGEVQFTEFGLSGPVIYEISRDACQSSGEWECTLDFLPDIPAEQLRGLLSKRRATTLNAEELCTGILHNRLGRVLVKEAGIRGNMLISSLTDGQIEDIVSLIKGFTVSLTEPLGMDAAQVTAGGIVTDEFDPQTMESRLVPGLYACGEVLDVDGDCGGYNLQWAWSSGRLAGFSAGKEEA